MHGAASMVELAAAMVGDVDPVDAVIERYCRVFGGGDALDHQGYLELVLDQFHSAPVQPLLEIAAGGAHAAGADIALGDVALPAAVMGGIDGEAERAVASLDGAGDAILDKGVVAADIELIEPQRVGGGFGGFLQARLRHRTQHMRRPERAGAAHHRSTSGGIEQFERADRRNHHWDPQPAAELLDGSIDAGDIAQHARPERDLVERHAVAAHRGLGLGGAGDIVPAILVEIGARPADQLVQVLELLAAGAEFDLRGNAWRLVHGVLPGMSDTYS